jgi:hypothetical protein
MAHGRRAAERAIESVQEAIALVSPQAAATEVAEEAPMSEAQQEQQEESAKS